MNPLIENIADIHNALEFTFKEIVLNSEAEARICQRSFDRCVGWSSPGSSQRLISLCADRAARSLVSGYKGDFKSAAEYVEESNMYFKRYSNSIK